MARDFGLEPSNKKTWTEADLFELLANEVADMIEHRIDLLLSLMYRLDVLEVDINAALNPANPVAANVALATLIMERQRQRVLTKRTYKTKPIEGWEF